jgi:hypothetical protein
MTEDADGASGDRHVALDDLPDAKSPARRKVERDATVGATAVGRDDGTPSASRTT